MIYRTKLPSSLFVGCEYYAMCQRCRDRALESLMIHDDVEFLRLITPNSQGLLYHMILPGENGRIPMMALNL